LLLVAEEEDEAGVVKVEVDGEVTVVVSGVVAVDFAAVDEEVAGEVVKAEVEAATTRTTRESSARIV
jgi:sulfur transfer protein SufE